MNIAIVGCGLIGEKRAKNLGQHNLVACVDPQLQRAQSLTDRYGASNCKAFFNLVDALQQCQIDIVIISVLHNLLAPLATQALKQGKHVLIEKPGGLCAKELAELATLERNLDHPKIHVGFNHRYHRAFRKAHELFRTGELGELMFIRARYGHGGRIGYDKEWRANPKLSGGGELIDQGVHLIDLARWFLGDFTDIQGLAHTYYWDMPVDDNCFLTLKTKANQVAFLHASCTEWKNTFSFEIYGQHGKLEISGLGGSYGTETLKYYKMLPQMGPPETTIWEYPMADDSWSCEFNDFVQRIQSNTPPAIGVSDAYATLNIVEQIYKVSNYDHHKEPA